MEEAKKTALGGFAVEYHASLGSTNDRAKELARTGKRNVCVIADAQEKGRGRNGRPFFSPPGCGLYLSVVTEAREGDLLTVRAAVAVSGAIGALTGRECGIKWVNDLLLDGKKVCGILAEGVSGCGSGKERERTGKPDAAVLGIGVNLRKTAFPPELAGIATDLESATGVSVGRDALAEAILTRLAEPWDAADVLGKYRARCVVLGKTVTVRRGNEVFSAKALDVDEAGALLVEAEGRQMRLFSGEVTAVRNGG